MLKARFICSNSAFLGKLLGKMAPAIFLAVTIMTSSGCVTSVNGGSQFDKQRATEANVKLGMAYLKKKDRENALRAFDTALKLDKNSAEAHQGMALIHQQNGEPDRAEKSFKKAMDARADFSKAGVYMSYGRFLYSQKRFGEALKYFTLASDDIAYATRFAAFYYKGLIFLSQNDNVRARAAFELALNLNSSMPQPALELADLAFANKDFASAQTYLNQFLANNKRPTARSLWLSIRIEGIFENHDKKASSVLALRNLYPYSNEYLLYKQSLRDKK